jgi:glycosyltransferase involved in cell wall biosynthesis
LTDLIPVSVVVIARNEERNIADCLRSTARFGQTLVVDSYSDDRSAEIAASLSAEVVEFSRDGGHPKKEPARRLEQAAVDAADSVVARSPGFRDYLVVRGADPGRIETVYNRAVFEQIASRPPNANGGPVRFLYAGNPGYRQAFETLVDAARIGGDRVSVEIVRGGNATDMVLRLSTDVPNITVRAPVDRRDYDSELPARLRGRPRAHAEQKLAKAPALERFEAVLG